jgi:hypothetical protein
MKEKIDIEKLLQWALREELPKGHPVSASAWDVITNFATLGTRVDVSRGSYDGLGFVPGTPHPDAETVGAAVKQLPVDVKLTEAECAGLLGHYAHLDPLAVRAVVGAPFQMQALVIRCAVLGERMPYVFPNWIHETPHPQGFRHENNKVAVFGFNSLGELTEIRQDPKSHRYSLEACPRAHLRYVDPSVGELLEARAEYAIWHRALILLHQAVAGKLTEYQAIEPSAHAAPWNSGQASAPMILRTPSGRMAKLPLGPSRPTLLPPLESDIERKAREWRNRRHNTNEAIAEENINKRRSI